MQTITISLNALYAILAAFVVGCVVIFLLVVWLSESRLVINCDSLSFYGINPQSFIKEYPQYAARLDKNDNGIPCQKTK